MNRIRNAALAIAATVAMAAPAAAQTVTSSDIQRLQDTAYQASNDVSQLRGHDATRASQLQAELDDLRDEVIYLKVKLRKNNSLTRAEYADVRDRLDDLRTRARNDSYAVNSPSTTTPSTAASGASPRYPSSTATTGTQTTTARAGEVPAGTELDVRLVNSLNSGTAKVEDRFEGTTLTDLSVNNRVAIPAGAVMRGVVTAVEPATRTNRTSKMTVSFDQVTINNRSYPIRATVTQALEGEGIKGEAGRTAAGAGVGAIIGGILGGFKGALAGILIGGGGTIAATEGKQIELPQGTVLRVRFDSPAQIGR